jgi:hypothetical protein
VEAWIHLGQCTTVFQPWVHAIMAWTVENLDGSRRNRNIYILLDSQAATKAANNHHINSKLVWECHQSTVKLAEHNRVQLIWVPGHRNIESNETVDHFARLQSECPLIGPQPACDMSWRLLRSGQRPHKVLGVFNMTETCKRGSYNPLPEELKKNC